MRSFYEIGIEIGIETENKNNIERHKSLRADMKSTHIDKDTNQKTKYKRRISSAALRLTQASMTVEASLVLPVFIFCMVNILMIFQMVEYQSRILAAVHQTGNRISRDAFLGSGLVTDTGETCAEDGSEECGVSGEVDSGKILSGENIIGAAASLAYIPAGVSEYLGDSISEKGCISGGKGGISYAGSNVLLNDDIVDIHASFRVRPAYADYGWNGSRMYVRYYGRGWTGYDVTRTGGEKTDDDRMVFITKTGTVYHLSRGCSSLCPSVHGVPYESISRQRNSDGKRYGRCPYCGTHVPGGTVYVTDYGTCYHTSPCCRGLKRTVYSIPLSEVGDREPCAICGGGE